MEFCPGVKIDEIDQLNKLYGKGGAKKASDILVRVCAKMIFVHGHVHCDPHPGNILVRPNPDDPKRP